MQHKREDDQVQEGVVHIRWSIQRFISHPLTHITSGTKEVSETGQDKSHHSWLLPLPASIQRRPGSKWENAAPTLAKKQRAALKDKRNKKSLTRWIRTVKSERSLKLKQTAEWRPERTRKTKKLKRWRIWTLNVTLTDGTVTDWQGGTNWRKWTDRQIQTDRQTTHKANKIVNKNFSFEANRQTDRQTARQTDRQTNS